jgi:hypothetical protein
LRKKRPKGGTLMQKIHTFLMFDGDAEEAIVSKGEIT